MGLGGGEESGLNRKKKTPEEIAAEQAEANQDDFTSKYPIASQRAFTDRSLFLPTSTFLHYLLQN